MVASDQRAIASTTAAKQMSTIRMVRNRAHSSMWSMIPLITFSLRMTDGARSVALEQLITAESTAPKNITCANADVCSTIKVGKTSWESLCNNAPNFSGSTSNAEYAINIGTKQKEK